MDRTEAAPIARRRTPVRAPAPLGTRVAVGAITAAYAAIALAVLFRGHPHEDAYILFKYAREVAAGHGVVFFRGGPHAEGATDFAWMIAIATARKVGVDPAFAAAAIDTAGVGVTAWLFLRVIARSAADAASEVAPPHPRLRAAAFTLVPLLLVVAPSSLAGYLGFSAPAFAAVALALYVVFVGDDDRVVLVPPLALALAFVRPDGAIVGAAFTLLAVPRARARALLRPFAVAAAASAAVGGAYFAWRWRYFGAPLPLPLYVKSHYAGTPPGLGETIDWFWSTLLPLAGLAVAARLLLGRLPRGALRARLVGLVPFALHVAGFVPTFPSQNVANRFQSPDALVLFYFAFVTAVDRAAATRPHVARIGFFSAISFAAFAPQAVVAADAFESAFDHGYVDTAAWSVGKIATRAGLRIAATEAGRVLYWTDAPTLDLVGLNSPETARVPPSRALLDAFDPDVVMLHPAGTMNEDLIEAGRTRDAVLPLETPLTTYLWDDARVYAAPDLAPYDVLHRDNVHVAPIATTAWIASRGTTYECWAARFRSRFARFHVWCLRATLPEKDAILAALRRAEVTGAAERSPSAPRSGGAPPPP